jgi:hypothetical protein
LLDDSWINIEKDQYGIGDNMKVTYFLDTPDFTANDYYIRLYDASGECKEAREVFASSSTEYFETLGYAAGMAYSLLVKDTEPATTYEDNRDLVELAFDVTNMLDSVFIRGITYDAETGTPLPNVSINFTQADSQYNTTSDANGTYEFTYQTGSGDILTNETIKFVTDVAVQANASKEEFWHGNFSFTPLKAGTMTVDLYLIPECENLTHNSYTVAGLTLSYPFHQTVGSANVHIKNEDSWSNNTVSSSSMGYYIFDNLPAGSMYGSIENETFNSSDYDTWVSLGHTRIKSETEKVTNISDEIPYTRGTDYIMNYTDGKIKVLSTGNMNNSTEYHIDYDYFVAPVKFYVNASKDGYEDSSTYEVEIDDKSECKYQNIILHKYYNLTIHAKDASTHMTLTDFYAIFNDQEQKASSSFLYIVFTNVSYGLWKVQVTKDGYYPEIKYIYVAEDTNETFYLTPITGTPAPAGPGAYYNPHTVDFKLQDLFGNPVVGAIVTAEPIATTLGSWDWINTLYGYPEDVDIRNTTLSGTSDSSGSAAFTMVEAVKYRIAINDTSRGITKVVEIYPKDNHYTIVIGFLVSTTREGEIETSFYTDAINDTHRMFGLNYTDAGNQTQTIKFMVYTRPSDEPGNYTLVYSEEKSNNNASFSYVAENWQNMTYYVGYNATMNDGSTREETKGYEYHIRQILWDLGLKPEEYHYYAWISFALLILIGAMFSGLTVKFGAIFVPIFALLLWYIGWLRFAGDTLILGTAMVMGVLFYFKEKSREEGIG